MTITTCRVAAVRSGERMPPEVTSRAATPASTSLIGMVNCMGRSAESARDVGRGDRFEAIWGPPGEACV